MNEFYAGLAEILEVDPAEISPSFDLTTHNWDSLAVVTTLALVDECYGVLVNGSSLAKCVRVSDIEALVESAKGG